MNFSEGQGSRKGAIAEWLGTFALLFAAACVVLRPAVAAGGVLRGLGLCYETVIPALFPFMVLSRLLLESPAAVWFGLLLRPYTRLLGLRGKKAPAALLCGLLGGFACGAQAVDALYRAGEVNRDEAARLLVCTIGSGPGFIVGGVGALMLGRAGAGRLLLAAQVSASLLCGAIAAAAAALQRRTDSCTGSRMGGMRRAAVACAGTALPAAAAARQTASANTSAPSFQTKPRRFAQDAKAASKAVSGQAVPKVPQPSPASAAPEVQQAAPASAALKIPQAAPTSAALKIQQADPASAASEPPQTGFVPAVRGAVTATVTLCGYVTLFSFFAAIVVPAGAPALLRYCAMLPLEVTSACRAACETAGIWRSELCCAALSVMGASVFFQVRALTSSEISLRPLLFSRFAHLPLALVLFRALARLFPNALAAGAQLDAAILPAVRMPPDVMAVLFVLCALACGALRPKSKSGKLMPPGALRGGQKRI